MSEVRGLGRLVSKSEILKRAHAVAREYADTGRPILAVGEIGTGKRFLARALHEEQGGSGPFIDTRAQDLTMDVLHSSPSNSMLFIQEVSDLDRETQVALVAAYQEDDFSALPRLFFSSLPNLPVRITSGDCLPELYFQLAACEITLPPLRSRKGDLPLLIDYFARSVTEELGRPKPRIDVTFIDLLAEYPFPGNLQELRMVVRKAVHWAQGDRLTADVARETLNNHTINSIADKLVEGRAVPLSRILFPASLPTVAEAKKQLILEALRRADGNQSQAARVLGLTPPAISKFLTRLDQQG